MRVLVGFTGASCSVYGFRLVEELSKYGHQVSVVFTENGLKVAAFELKKKILTLSNIEMKKVLWPNLDSVVIENNQNMFAKSASGTNSVDAMVIMPCSMGTLAAVASGLSLNLMQRTADVVLKERKKLILAVREAPFSLIHLRNMTEIVQAGAVVLPCSPGFYNHPQSLKDIEDFMVAKVLDCLEIKHSLVPKWQGDL